MAKLTFSDGMTINTGGEYRVTRKSDGLYVVGHGVLIPVRDGYEAQQILNDLKKKKK